jgi:AraC-like DNA-binding protein
LRLQHSLMLLAEHQDVTSVALKCGWATPSAFIDTYRRAFGHTPGARRP